MTSVEGIKNQQLLIFDTLESLEVSGSNSQTTQTPNLPKLKC